MHGMWEPVCCTYEGLEYGGRRLNVADWRVRTRNQGKRCRRRRVRGLLRRRQSQRSICQGHWRPLLFFVGICSPQCTTSSLSWSAKYFLSALDLNGPIAVRLFILSHFTYVKGIGSCRQRAASAFGCVLGGLTGDRLWWAGESGFKRHWKRRTARWNMFGVCYQ